MTSHAQRLASERERIRQFLAGSQCKIVIDVQGLSHREICGLLYGGGLAEIGVGIRYVLALMLYACPFPGIKNLVYRAMGMHVGKGAYISPGCYLDVVHPGLLTIGDNAVLGMGSAVATHERCRDVLVLGRVEIGSGALVGGMSVVRAGTRIGANAELDMMLNVSRNVAPGERVPSPRNGRPLPPLPEK
ncbi:MAG: hypothetical protein IPN71_14140 [Fibrobacteres bacterium]|nr:hypothetical protein [Fibrobacterota bacterium]